MHSFSAAFTSIPACTHRAFSVGKELLQPYPVCTTSFNMSYANVRRVMLKHKRATKCPLLTKFLSRCVTSAEGNFVSTSELFSAYETALSIWTDDDSIHGQTKFLMKRSSFNRVSIFFTFAHDFRPLRDLKS